MWTSRAIVSLLIAATALMGSAPRAAGQTVGLYDFDTMARDWSVPGGPERFFDTSGHDLHFNARGAFGTIGLSADVPAIAPAGSLSLNFNFRSEVDTPATDLFSMATTGELTIEFWYKPLLTDTARVILAMENGPNAWSLSQAVPAVNGAQGVYLFAKDMNGNADTLKSADGFLDAGDPQWVHLAFTFDQTGTLRMYRDGVLEDQASGFGPYSATTHTLRLGANNPDGTFAGKFRMDDLRISHTALEPGSGTGVGELAWNTSLSHGVEPVARPTDFGRQWVRSNPFTISAWGRPANELLYREANFNTAQSSLALDGIAGHFQAAFNELNDATRTAVQWGINAGVTGWLIRDEVPADKIAGVADVAEYVRTVDPDSLVYVSLASINPTYVDQVLTTIQPDAFVYGFYPWEGPTNATDKLRAHLDNMQTARQKSLQHGIPVFAFIQSFDDLNNPDQGIEDNNRLPSGSELRAELFLKLSAGFKGVTYYLFDLENQSPRFEKALLDADGNPTPLYEHAKQANAEILTLGQSLRYLESTDWRFLSGGGSITPNTIPAWSASAGSGRIQDIDMLGTPADRKDAMIGYFEDDLGEAYFMLVNMHHGAGLDPEQLAESFTITFDDGVDTIWRLNRLTGAVDEIALDDHMLTLTLPGGTGDLFKFDNGDFPGLTLLRGDFNLDGLLTNTDIQAMLDALTDLAGYQSAHGLSDDDLRQIGDINGDNLVSNTDIQAMLDLLTGGDVARSVPEPGSLVWLTLLAGAMRRRGQASAS